MKIPVRVLGATGSVGQKFIQLLDNHPLFTVAAVAASDRSAGRRYAEAVRWVLPTPIPEAVRNLKVQPATPETDCPLVFSGLDASVAGPIEEAFANAGCIVVSNSRNHRWNAAVPLLVPEVNPEHLELLPLQQWGRGKIITNPNCSTIGLVLAVKPLFDRFGLKRLNVVTMQALSGAGYPGVASLDIIDNAIPFIPGEEEKVESEPLKILGRVSGDRIENLSLPISAQCNRVGVLDGHLETVQVDLQREASVEEIIEAWRNFRGVPQDLALPSAPSHPIRYLDDPFAPQPRLHRDAEKGMGITIGRLRPCRLFDYKFALLSHNTVRGAAGGAILCAELLHARGLLA